MNKDFYQWIFNTHVPELFEDFIAECSTREEVDKTVEQIVNNIFNDETKKEFIKKLDWYVKEWEDNYDEEEEEEE